MKLNSKPTYYWKINFSKIAHVVILSIVASPLIMSQAFAQTETGDTSLVVAKGVSSDGTVHVTITSTQIELHRPMALQVSFTDSSGNKIQHENYGILGMQQEGNGIVVLSNATAYAENGDDLQVTLPLDNTSPVVFRIQLQGSGLPGTDSSTWKGPQGDTVAISVVPEFGSLVPIILVLSFVAIIAIMKKSGIGLLQFGNPSR